MSARELQRINVLSEVLAKRRTEISAAAVLGISTRQTRRLLIAYRDGGGTPVIHKARGRQSNNQMVPGIREYAIELVRSRYADFGPTLAAEMLMEKDGSTVSRETLRKWMVADGLWLSRKQRRTFHQPRLRRECYGERIQIAGSASLVRRSRCAVHVACVHRRCNKQAHAAPLRAQREYVVLF